jgi:hypothetical protein
MGPFRGFEENDGVNYLTFSNCNPETAKVNGCYFTQGKPNEVEGPVQLTLHYQINLPKLVSTRRSTVLSLPLQKQFPALLINIMSWDKAVR